jgi:hypothetical protein
MKAVTLFKTSRGLFLNLHVAEQHKNRQKDNDPRSPNFGQREEVVPVVALEIDGEFYELKPLAVK